MSNIRLDYLYRDADNFKCWSSAIFTNPGNLSVESVKNSLGAALIEFSVWPDVMHFRPEWIGLPSVFLFASQCERTDSDFDWHEIDEVSNTEDEPNDTSGRSIDDLIRNLERTHGRPGGR